MFRPPFSLSGMWLKTAFVVALLPFESVIINALRVRRGGDLLVEWIREEEEDEEEGEIGAETDEVAGRFGLGGEWRVWRTWRVWER